ncbi:MAG: hypothetical protein V3R25_06110 [Nitrosomonadaceae bacterium]
MTSISNQHVRTSGDMAESNRIHEECLAQCEAFKKRNPKKFIVAPIFKMPVRKETINKKSHAKPADPFHLKGLSTINKFKVIIKEFGSATRQQIAEFTQLSLCTTTKNAKVLQDMCLIERDQVSGIGTEVTFTWVGE